MSRFRPTIDTAKILSNRQNPYLNSKVNTDKTKSEWQELYTNCVVITVS